jgi:hypothetical protein
LTPEPYVVVVVTVETAGASASEEAPLGRTAGYSGPRTGIRIEPESADESAWLPDVVTGSGDA